MVMDVKTEGLAQSGSGGASVAVTITGLKENIAFTDFLKLKYSTGLPTNINIQIANELGMIMQRNIIAGGRPQQWQQTYKQAMGITSYALYETGRLFNALGDMAAEGAITDVSEPLRIGRGVDLKSKRRVGPWSRGEGASYLNTLIKGGTIYPASEHHLIYSGKVFGLAFRDPINSGGIGGNWIRLRPNQPVNIPPRDFTTIPESDTHRLNSIINNFITDTHRRYTAIMEPILGASI